MSRTLAVVMARGGSKGVPGKNVRPLSGKPLIAYTFEAAKESGRIDRLVLSSDSPAIAQVAKEYGVEVPFMRPHDLALDDTPGFDAFLHCVKWLADVQGYNPDFILELLPTSPFRLSSDINAAIELINASGADSVVSVTPATQHPFWMKSIDGKGRIKPFIESQFTSARRQDLPGAFALNGAIKIARREVIIERRTWYTENTYAYVMPPERSLDIDTPWDFQLAELIISHRNQGEAPAGQ